MGTCSLNNSNSEYFDRSYSETKYGDQTKIRIMTDEPLNPTPQPDSNQQNSNQQKESDINVTVSIPRVYDIVQQGLIDPWTFKFLMKFAQNKLCSEPLYLYQVLMEYYQTSFLEIKQRMARRILDKYIKNGAPQQISSLSYSLRNDVISILNTIISLSSPSDVTEELTNKEEKILDNLIYCLIENISMDIWPRYVESNLYSQYYLSKTRRIQQPKLRDFIFCEPLGEGAFGKVLKVKKKSNNKYYALKVISKASLLHTKRHNPIEVLNEIKFLRENVHPFIVSLHYSFHTTRRTFLVMDLVTGPTFQKFLKRPLPEAQARFYAAELILVLKYLHEKGIHLLFFLIKQGYIYRDLKPNNVMITTKGHICVTDFGCVVKVRDNFGKIYRRKTIIGAFGYKAPEMLRGEAYDFAVDWWSLGLFVYAMLVCKHPFRTLDIFANWDSNVLKCDIEIPHFLSEEARDLLSQLLEKDATKRIGSKNDAEEIMNHPFFSGVDWIALYNQEYYIGNIQKLHNHSPSKINFKTLDEALQQFTPHQHISHGKNESSSWKESATKGKILTPDDVNVSDQKYFKGFSWVSPSALLEEIEISSPLMCHPNVENFLKDHGISANLHDQDHHVILEVDDQQKDPESEDEMKDEMDNTNTTFNSDIQNTMTSNEMKEKAFVTISV